jgi:hypothetical protein
VEFEAQHPAWPIYATEEMMLDCDVAPLIGARHSCRFSRRNRCRHSWRPDQK